MSVPSRSTLAASLRSAAASARTAIVLGSLVSGCAIPEGEGAVESRAAAVTSSDAAAPGAAAVDVLFLIANSSNMGAMQAKMVAEIPVFLQRLGKLPWGFPDLHVAVVSSDMGAPGDSTAALGCTTSGDSGLFQTAPRGSCSATTLAPSSAFILDVGGMANYSGNLADVLGCILPLGTNGCSFGQPLGSIARALGADGAPAPPANAGFLRQDAQLAIIILSDEDDCSAPLTTTLYSLGNEPNSLADSLGPLAPYRCNEWGHFCLDPTGVTATLISPPAIIPSDARNPSTAPTLPLTSCESNDTAPVLVSPLSQLVMGIKGLKANPDNSIVVAAIVGPSAPYTVAWVPPPAGVQNLPQGELWPQIEPSCGAAGVVNPAGQTVTDGSLGDPSVRITQFAQSFANGVVTSICDSSYDDAFAPAFTQIAYNLEHGGPGAPSGSGGTPGMGGFGGGLGGGGLGGAGSGAGGSGPSNGTGGSGGGSSDGGRSSGSGGASHFPIEGLRDGCACAVPASPVDGVVPACLLALLVVARRRRASGR